MLSARTCVDAGPSQRWRPRVTSVRPARARTSSRSARPMDSKPATTTGGTWRLRPPAARDQRRRLEDLTKPCSASSPPSDRQGPPEASPPPSGQRAQASPRTDPRDRAAARAASGRPGSPAPTTPPMTLDRPQLLGRSPHDDLSPEHHKRGGVREGAPVSPDLPALLYPSRRRGGGDRERQPLLARELALGLERLCEAWYQQHGRAACLDAARAAPR